MALDLVSLSEINERTVESVEQDQTTEIMRTDLSVHYSSNESTVVDESGECRAKSDCRSMPGDLSAHSTKKKNPCSQTTTESAKQDPDCKIMQTDLSVHSTLNKSMMADDRILVKESACGLFNDLTLSQTINFRLFQTDRVCRQQFQNW